MNEYPKDAIDQYWLKHYTDAATGCCSLCGNHGVVDTTGVTTIARISVGRKNFCICPNGRALRDLQESEQRIKASLDILNSTLGARQSVKLTLEEWKEILEEAKLYPF